MPEPTRRLKVERRLDTGSERCELMQQWSRLVREGGNLRFSITGRLIAVGEEVSC